MSRARRVDAETAELARRRLEVVLTPRRALAAPLDHTDLDLAPDPDLDPDLDSNPDLTGDPAWDEEDQLDPTDIASPRGREPTPLTDRARRFTRGHLGVVLALAVVGLLVAAAGVARARPLAVTDPGPAAVSVSAAASAAPSREMSGTPGASASTSPPTQIVVHVLGAVRRPGVVRLPTGTRVADAIAAAGGLAPAAVPGELNLAQPLLDGQQIMIVSRPQSRRDPPERSEVRDPGSGSGSGSSGTSASSGSLAPGGKVNLNTATAAQLDTLSGVGPVTAQRILDWRTEHGRFARVEELQEVDGIGPKTFAELAPQVTV